MEKVLSEGGFSMVAAFKCIHMAHDPSMIRSSAFPDIGRRTVSAFQEINTIFGEEGEVVSLPLHSNLPI